MTMPRLTRDERWRAVGLLDARLSARQVARRFGCNVSTIARLLQRHKKTGSVADRPRPGRARVPAQGRYIVMQHLRDRFRTATQTARETAGRHQPRISANTVRRRLRSRDLHARRPVRGMVLTAERRQNRARWARQHRPWTLPWPAYSPDLSQIEHLWDQLGRRVANRTPPPQNRQEMVTALEEEWPNIPQDNLRRLVRSMRRRITACLAANGGHTPY